MDGEEAEVTDLKYLRSHPDENKLTSFEQLKVGDDVIAYHSRNMIKYEAVVIPRLTPTGIKKICHFLKSGSFLTRAFETVWVYD